MDSVDRCRAVVLRAPGPPSPGRARRPLFVARSPWFCAPRLSPGWLALLAAAILTLPVVTGGEQSGPRAAPRRRGGQGASRLRSSRPESRSRPPAAVTSPPAIGGENDRELPTVAEGRRIVDAQNDIYQVTLTEIHRRFPSGNGQPIVAALVLRDVQRRVAGRGGVTSRFLAVDTPAMNRDHLPKDAFEQRAVDELARGARRVEAVEPPAPDPPSNRRPDSWRLRVALPVPLGGSCFPCHATPRGESGRAAISWSVALAAPPEPPSGQRVGNTKIEEKR